MLSRREFMLKIPSITFFPALGKIENFDIPCDQLKKEGFVLIRVSRKMIEFLFTTIPMIAKMIAHSDNRQDAIESMVYSYI